MVFKYILLEYIYNCKHFIYLFKIINEHYIENNFMLVAWKLLSFHTLLKAIPVGQNKIHQNSENYAEPFLNLKIQFP